MRKFDFQLFMLWVQIIIQAGLIILRLLNVISIAWWIVFIPVYLWIVLMILAALLIDEQDWKEEW